MDTVSDELVFEVSQLFHHDVYNTGDESSQNANYSADHPATDLKIAETLTVRDEEWRRKKNEQGNEKRAEWKMENLHKTPSCSTHRETHPPLLFQKQLIFDVVIVQALKQQDHNTSLVAESSQLN